jgi:uncharacterized repeat protein (TIGR01451 family)
VLVVAATASASLAQVSADLAVEVSATVQKTPASKITLTWPSNSQATGYTIYRKAFADTTWGGSIATLAGSATSYADTNVSVGNTYEYQVLRQGGVGGYGYLASGIEVPLTESRGKVVLLVDSSFSAPLATELSQLEQDLTGDGWIVLRHDVSRTDSVISVKALILNEYARDPGNVRAVFLFGHVPVPYAGAIAPDGHGNHYGAWPADMFYADIDGVWTDTVNYDSTVAGRQHNVAGDGKFDQSSAPSTVDLEVGRVDLSNMPAFAPKTEQDLLQQYLNKDHSFRHALTTAQARGLIDDNFGYFGGEAFGSTGWRAFSSFFAAANVQALDWFTTLATQSYLWAYGCGGGSFTGAGGVGSTSNFVATDTQVVFTMLFGSYFGDWDSTNNFLRAPLATTTYGLTDAWAGRPPWYFHHMAMGETTGYSALVTQNNSGLYWYAWGPSVHVALMGDPTLRMHPVAPPSGLTAVPSGGKVTLNWAASPDSAVGYNVYRSPSPFGPFTRLNGSLIAGTGFLDAAVSSAAAGTYTYMVRAIKLETSASGSYFNASQGIFQDASAGSGSLSADVNVTADAAPLTVVTGSGISYAISVSNGGPADATGVVLTHTVPAGLTFASAPAGCSFSAGLVTCAVGALARGARTDYTIALSATSTGTFATSSHASAVQFDPVSANNTAGTSVTAVAMAASATLLSSSLNPSTLGQIVTFSATATAAVGGTPTGTVTFKDGAASLGTGPLDTAGKASISISALSAGTHSITASYGGDSHFGASSSPVISQAVKASTTTMIASSFNPSVLGQAVTLTATVTSASGMPTGSVSFKDGAILIASGSLDAVGQTSITITTLSAGSHSLVASYNGDTGHNPSNSSALAQMVSSPSGAASSTALASSINPSALGQSVAFTATVTSTTAGTPTGSVSFISGTTLLGTASLDASAKAVFTTTTLTPGSHSLRATYNGNATFNPSTSALLTQTVRDTSSVALASSANPSAPGQTVTFTATITPGSSSSFPTGTVTFYDSAAVIGMSSVFFPGRATFNTSTLSTGSHSITAAYSGDTLVQGSTSPALVQIVAVAGGMSFYTVTPCRLVDTRTGNGPLGGPALVAGAQRTFALTGRCAVPASARSLSLNVTVTGPTTAGDLRLFPSGITAPGTTTINYRAAQTRANNAIASLGTTGNLTVQCDQASGTVQLILDVNGYFQ